MTAVFHIAAPREESRPIELHTHRERGRVHESRWVEEKAMSHHQTWDALNIERSRLGVETKKNKTSFFSN